MKLRVLDLFSGIGGFSLGLDRTGGFKTIAFCEIEEFPRKVLAKHWPNVPIFRDVRTLHASDIEGAVDVICGGYPCQPFSVAGRRQGEKDDRHLWPEMLRLIKENRPNWVIAENVAGHVNMGLDQVLTDLEDEDYEATAFIIPACAVNAPHRRDRVWIIAHNGSHPKCGGLQGESWGGARKEHEDRHLGDNPFIDGNTDMQRCRERLPSDLAARSELSSGRTNQEWVQPWVEAATRLCRMDDGVSRGMDRTKRLKSLGNAVVPQIPELIGIAILATENQHR